MGIRDMSVEAEHGLDLIPNSPIVRETYGLGGAAPAADRMAAPIVDDAIPYDAVWDCVTCGACVEACPVLIEHVDKIVGLRRNLVLEESRFPAELAGAFRGMEGQGNPWGQPASTRLDWTKGLPFEVPTVAAMAADGKLDELEVLYWVGCAAAFDERNKRVARAFATCLTRPASASRSSARRSRAPAIRPAGWATTTSSRSSPPATSRRSTDTGWASGRSSRPAPIASTRSATSTASWAGRSRSSTTRSISRGCSPTGGCGSPTRGRRASVTFHDSCYMARYNGVIAAPRDVLGSVPGVELREMEKSGKNTFCCGAGGGRMWMEETRGTRINAERTRQALETGAETVATSCPFCMVMMKDGLADAAAASRLRRRPRPAPASSAPATSRRSWPTRSLRLPARAAASCQSLQ